MRAMKRTFLLLLALLSASAFAGPNPFDEVNLKGSTDKANPVGYEIGEPIVFTLRTENLAEVPEGSNYRVRWKRTGDDGLVKEGESRLRVGETCVVTTKMDRAGFVRREAHVVGGGGGWWVQRSKPAPGCEDWYRERSVFFDGGAGVAVDRIVQEQPEPADFDAYWAKQKARLAEVPVTAERKDLGTVGGCRVYAVSIACAGPQPATGYLYVPEGAAPKSCGARVAFQGYGTYVQARPDWAAAACAANREIFLEVNAHGYELGHHRGFYDAFFRAINTSGKGYAFNAQENADPDTCYFNGMALRAMRAVEYLKTLPEWNGRSLVAEGGSQGGLQTSWVAGLGLGVTLARPSITWGCDMGMPGGAGGRLRGPWHLPYGKGLDYYDAVNHIRRAKCPVEVTRAGLGDYTCPPSGLALYFNAIPGPKSIRWVQGSEHGFIPPGENQVAVLGDFRPTGGESKSQNASSSVK
jgi:cephalosporin-C deacetylase-like acetyl esterase